MNKQIVTLLLGAAMMVRAHGERLSSNKPYVKALAGECLAQAFADEAEKRGLLTKEIWE